MKYLEDVSVKTSLYLQVGNSISRQQLKKHSELLKKSWGKVAEELGKT